MAFRADEAAETRFQAVLNEYAPRSLYETEGEFIDVRDFLFNLREDIGHVVDTYPNWHPLINSKKPDEDISSVDLTWNYPTNHNGYNGLDKAVCFVNGFITCPYNDGQAVLDSVSELKKSTGAKITAERLNITLRHPAITPILVKCEWAGLDPSEHIPASIALPLFLERFIPLRHEYNVSPAWETIRPHVLGIPHGSRSSLFVTQETGLILKKAWELLASSGMYGTRY
jgi:hypothetical protein